MLSGQLSGFSCPHGWSDDAPAHLIASEYARSIRVLLEDRFKPVCTDSKSVYQYLNCVTPLNLKLNWSSEIGLCADALKAGSEELALKSAASLALLYAHEGVTGTWQVTFAKPTRLLFGRYLLPACQQIAAQSRATDIQLECQMPDGWRAFEFARSSGGISANSPEALESLPIIRFAEVTIVLLSRGPANYTKFASLGDSLISDVDAATHSNLERAVRSLSAVSPSYFEWVIRLLQRLIIVSGTNDRLSSGNIFGEWGAIYISTTTSTAATWEMLVHEVSHQYYNLLTRLGPVDDGSDTNLYYSPFPKANRRIDRILLAYHAFANVLIFYCEAYKSGLINKATYSAMLTRHRPDVATLERHIDASRSLTDIGSGLYNPVRERLNACQF